MFKRSFNDILMRKTTLNHRHRQDEIGHYVIYVIVFIILASRNDQCMGYMWIHGLVNSPTPQSAWQRNGRHLV